MWLLAADRSKDSSQATIQKDKHKQTKKKNVMQYSPVSTVNKIIGKKKIKKKTENNTDAS